MDHKKYLLSIEIKSATCPPSAHRESEKYYIFQPPFSARSPFCALTQTLHNMVLKVGDADMDTLREQRAARLLAAEYYRLKSKHSLLCNESRILNNLLEAEARDYRVVRGRTLITMLHGTARCV